MIKVVEGTKEEFEKECNELENKGMFELADTYRVYEFCGRMYYSIIMKEEEKK